MSNEDLDNALHRQKKNYLAACHFQKASSEYSESSALLFYLGTTQCSKMRKVVLSISIRYHNIGMSV